MKHIFGAWKDFLTRYWGVFRSVWAVRKQLDPVARSAEELAFMPAQLELIETPVSPLPHYAIRIIIALFVVALLWSIIGKLDIDAVASGKVVPSGRTKIVQPLEAAVVKAILVKDGQFVRQGELLIELDPASTAADENKASEALSSAEGQAARYRALLAALDSGAPLPKFSFTPGTPEEVEAVNRLVQSEYSTFQAKNAALASAIAQKQAELATTRKLISSLAESARLSAARSSDLEALNAKEYVSKHDFLAAKQQQIEAERNHSYQMSRVAELSAAISAQRADQASQASDFRRQVMDGLRQATEQSAQMAQDVDKTGRRNQLMQIRAPVDGTVQQLAIHTVGGVVTPAQPLLAIVPKDESIEVEALLLNKDIGFVHEGQNAVVKIEAFPYTRYGYLTGKLVSVSHDAIQDEKLGLVFAVRVRLNERGLIIDGQPIRLTPGMALSVEVKTGERRVIDYLLSPLKTHVSEAMRER
ncbi:MAG: HlyD family type I secretion periplasmic adaptor subunit [Arenimonas sp.]|jgi:hemolysin D